MALPACAYDFDSVPYTTNKDLRPGLSLCSVSCICILQIIIDLCGLHSHLPLVVGRGYPLGTRLIRLTVGSPPPGTTPPYSHMGSCRKLARVFWQPFLHCGRSSTPRQSRFYSSTTFAELFRLPRGLASNAKMVGIVENYEEILKGKYPAKEHARKVAKWIIEKGGDKNGTIYLEAQKQKLNEDNDGEAPFRCG